MQIRLWVSNQSVVGADHDETQSYLDAADYGWTGGTVIELPDDRERLLQWFYLVFLSLQSSVGEAGWGEDIDDDVEESPQLVAYHELGNRYTSAGESLQQIYSAEERGYDWADAVMQSLVSAED